MSWSNSYIVTNLTGRRYSRLSVLRLSHINKNSYWVCRCDCGSLKITAANSLKSGQVRSCGCLVADSCRETHTKHGLHNHPIYRVWKGMITRCYNKNCPNYKNYGGRGIKVCSSWRNNFKLFYDWAISNGYKKSLSIDRYPNNDGNYEPDNCRWATPKMQTRNSRNTKLTLNEATLIRYLYKNQAYNRIELAFMFGVTWSNITAVVNYKSWN